MKNKLKQTFSKFRVVILAEDETAARMLGDSFGNRGASQQTFSEIDDALNSLQSQPTDIFLCMEKGFDPETITNLVKNARNLTPSPTIVWIIGEKILPLADGCTPYPFRPADLLKPIFFSLMVHEDLYASA